MRKYPFSPQPVPQLRKCRSKQNNKKEIRVLDDPVGLVTLRTVTDDEDTVVEVLGVAEHVPDVEDSSHVELPKTRKVSKQSETHRFWKRFKPGEDRR